MVKVVDEVVDCSDVTTRDGGFGSWESFRSQIVIVCPWRDQKGLVQKKA